MKKIIIMILCLILVALLIGCTPRPGSGFEEKGENVCGEYEIGGYYVNSCLYRHARNNKDLSVCDKIPNKGIKEDCIKAIAFDEKDKEICKNLKEGNRKEECIKLIDDSKDVDSCIKDRECKTKLIFINKEESLCNSLTEQSKMNCLQVVAIRKIDESICEKITDDELYETIKKDCFIQVAVHTANVNICDKTDDKKEQCVARIAMSTFDESFCDLLTSEKEMCLEGIEGSKKLAKVS